MTAQIALRTHPLADGYPPPWASAWGQDRYGPWAELELRTEAITLVTQRMRWIPAGVCLMGSPESEEGRFKDEGPVHEVVLSEGYWLFDTPCTQELWLAVMGTDPSRFKGDRRPVEQVSWDECQEFVVKLNGRVAGLELRLPTEAEWEYACRAGAVGARYGELDEVAWHGGNSGSETHDVALKVANGWGLYDMLGNVWEWCFDGKRAYASGRVFGPMGTLDAGAARVLRGGGWDGSARRVRAAYRSATRPGFRYLYLGFRCLSSGR